MSTATLDEIEVDAEAEAKARERALVEARNARVVENLGLAGRVAAAYLGHGLDFDDLFQEGVLGLMRAAEKFERDRGLRFSTVANYWIKAEILRGLTDQAHTIRMPESARDLERSTVIGMDTENLSQCAVAPEAADLAADLREWLETAMGKLSPRERHILELRFPADGSEPATLEQVAREMGVSRQRVQQIEVRALARMRQVVQDTPTDPRSPTAMPAPAVAFRHAPDALDHLAGRLHLVGEPTRLRVIFSLAVEVMHVAALVESLGTPQPLLSGHLALLRAAGLIEAERRGQRHYYRLTDAGRRVHAAVAVLMA